MLQIMAALIILESAIKPAYLKTSWRLWAFPAPNPVLAGMPSHLSSMYTLTVHIRCICNGLVHCFEAQSC